MLATNSLKGEDANTKHVISDLRNNTHFYRNDKVLEFV